MNGLIIARLANFDLIHEKGTLECIQTQVSISLSKVVKRQNEQAKFQNSGRRNYTTADILLLHTYLPKA